MGKGKYAYPTVTMGEVATWRNAMLEEHDVKARIVWSSGAHAGEWRVTCQAVVVVEGKAKVVAEVYDVWPKRGCSTVEALMLQLLVALERQLELPRPLIVGEQHAA